MIVKKHSSNVHELQIEGKEVKIAMLSDIHWDNPKCDRKTLKRHLDYCLEHTIPIHINGDFFCLMQGRADRRSSKSDILQEHNKANYLDAVVEDAVEWWSPYAHLITVIGYGNHETSIIKHLETDPLEYFVKILNYKNNTNVYTGGYGGWFIVNQVYCSTRKSNTRIKYFHGSGGGGIVTKGAINLTRALERYEGFDVFTLGHIHENKARNDVRDIVTHNSRLGYRMEHKNLHLMVTGAYKEEYGDGSKGWHTERGAPPKPVGGRILTINVFDREEDKKKRQIKHITSTEFAI